MKITLKKALAVMVASTMTLGLTACSGTESSVNNEMTKSDSEENSEVSQVKPGKKGSIEYWTVFTGADGKSMQSMVDAYNATEPDYTVNHRAIESNDLYLKLPLAIQSGQDVPDVAINHVERLPVFVENGFLTDLNSIIKDTEIKPDKYNEKVWGMSEINGGHYAVPLDYHTFVTYVNMDLYEKYGKGSLDDGYLTWDEIKASGEAAKEDSIIPVALTWYGANWRSSYAQLGGKMTSDGIDPMITDDSSVKVLNMWKELYDAGYTLKEGDTGWEMFLGGQVLYCPEGIWMLNNAKESGMNYKMVEYPAWDAEHRGGWTSSHQLVIPKDEGRSEEETKAALDFINWIGENSMEWAKAGQVPAHKAILENDEFKEMPQFFLTEDDDKIKMFEYKYYGYTMESIDKVLPEVLFGRMTPEDALRQAEQEARDRISTEQ